MKSFGMKFYRKKLPNFLFPKSEDRVFVVREHYVLLIFNQNFDNYIYRSYTDICTLLNH